MKKCMLMVAIAGAIVRCSAGTDGALLNIGGTNGEPKLWSDAANWLNGTIAADGGNLYITNSVLSYIGIDVDVNVNKINVHSPVPGSEKFSFAPRNINGAIRKLTLSGGEINFTAGSELRFFDNSLICDGDLVVNSIEGNNDGAQKNLGTLFLNTSQSIAGRIIANNAVIGFSQTPNLAGTEYRADAIVLNAGGIFNQGGYTTIAAKDGITLGPKGGYLMSGGIDCYLNMNSPIIGEGALMIEHQYSVVRLGNPANAWCGDTILGTMDRHASCASRPAEVILTTSEVIPHGPGKGKLIFKSNSSADNSNVNLTLNGTETVNAVESTRRTCVNINGNGNLVLASDDDSVLKAQIASGVIIEKRGSGILDFTDATMNGTLCVREGTTSSKAECFAADAVIDMEGGVLEMTGGGNLESVISVGSASTLNDRSAAGSALVLRGGVLSRTNDGVLTINVTNGDRVIFEGAQSGRPVVFDGKIVCNKSVEFRGNVWLKRPIEGNITVPAGASVMFANDVMLAYDYDIEGSGDETLMSSMRIVNNGRNGDTLTVGAGMVLELDTQAFENGVVVDPADAVRPFGVNVVLSGGILRFRGGGILNYTGTVSGNGRIEKLGTGRVCFANGSNLASGTVIDVQEGTFTVKSSGSVGGARVILNGGNVGNVPGEDLTGTFPIEVVKGTFDAGAEGTFVYAGTLTCEGGKVTVTGNGATAFDFAEGSDTVDKIMVNGGELKLVHTLKTGLLEVFRGSVDLNGFDFEIDELLLVSDNERRAAIRNDAAQMCELRIIGDGSTSSFGDLSGNFKIVRNGTGSTYFYARSCFDNAGITVNGGRVSVLPVAREMIAAQVLRWKIIKNRGKGLRANENNWQVSEFYLMNDGRDIAWPQGTTVTCHNSKGDIYTGTTPGNIIDGNGSTKMLASVGYEVRFDFNGNYVLFDSYTYMTGDDSPGRDPMCWTLEAGIIDGGVTNWVKVADMADASANVPPFTDEELEKNGAERKIKAAEFAATLPHSGDAEFNGIAFPEDYAIKVNAPGELNLCKLIGDLNGKLSGDGYLVFIEEVCGSITNNVQWHGETEFRKPVTNSADGAPVALEWIAAHARLTASGSSYGGVTRLADGAVLDVGSRSIKTRYLKLSFQKTAANNPGANNSIQLDEVDLYLNGQRVPWPEGTIGSTAILPGSGGEKQVSRLMDNQRDGSHKYFNQGLGNPITWAFPTAVEIDGYSLWTGNDCISGYQSGYSPSYARHPTSWTMEYSDDGINWMLLDKQVDNTTLVDKNGNTMTFAYGDYVTGSQYFDAEFYKFRTSIVEGGVISAASDVVLDDAASVMKVNTVHEEVKSLAGSGTIRIEDGGELYVSGNGKAFAGVIEGNGVVAKVGEGVQTLSGTLKCGEIVVESGALNLDGATLNGVTNIILRGGVLTGTATCANDLRVCAEGGACGAEIAISGKLFIEEVEGNKFKLFTGDGAEVRKTSFTFAQCDEESRAAFKNALISAEPQKGLKFSIKESATTLGFSIANAGTVLIFR